MIRKISVLFLLLATAAFAEYDVKTVSFFDGVNAVGPVVVKTDAAHNRIISANALSSSVSVIDGQTDKVTNIPIGGRALQHLKAESMTINRITGEVCLIGTKCLFIINPESGDVKKFDTDVQFESVAIDDKSGNVFIAGRESKELVMYSAESGELEKIDWLDDSEKLLNMNQTPPPPIRRVVAANELRQIVAMDGNNSMIYIFDALSGEMKESFKVDLSSGGRWHFAGYDENKHQLFLATETSKRKIDQAALIDPINEKHSIVKMPEGFSEPVGISYNPKLGEMYIAYDNQPSVHVIDFAQKAEITEIAIPAFGNDAVVMDVENDMLYIGSWAEGEVEVVDLKKRKFVKKITGLGIIPHMFAMAFNPNNGFIYFPIGATAVNGCFGASLTKLDPKTEEYGKVYLGWAPIDLIELEKRKSFLVFNNEDQFAEVNYDGSYKIHQLPYDQPITACYGPDNNVYLSYGAHQSYWPTVYIWGAKNGVLKIDSETLDFYDRRIPAQAMQMALGKDGTLYLESNNWGRREQFISILKDGVRKHEIGDRIQLGDTVQRETTQRIMKYDEAVNKLYLCRVSEKDNEAGILQIINLDSNKVEKTISVGIDPTDLTFDDKNIYVTNFHSDFVSIVRKKDYVYSDKEITKGMLKIIENKGKIYAIGHLDNTLYEIKNGNVYRMSVEAMPDGLFVWDGKIVITAHNPKELLVHEFNPETNALKTVFKYSYPYGETSFDTYNSAFYLTGQFGDAIYDLCRAKESSNGKLWLTDFLSGKLFIIKEK